MSIGVCYFVGVPVGAVVLGLLNGSPLLAFETDIDGVPVILYAFIFDAPFAIVAGVLGGAVLTRLLRSEDWNPAWLGWMLTCGIVGAIGAVGSLFLLAAIGLVDIGRLFPVVTFLGVTCGSCGALLGLYGWSVKQKGQAQLRSGTTTMSGRNP